MLHLNACLLILLVISSQVNGDVNHIVLKHPSYPDQCYLETDKGPFIMDSELARYPGKCANVYCGRNSFALIFSCTAQSIPERCTLGNHINMKAAFPECCERDWECNDDK